MIKTRKEEAEKGREEAEVRQVQKRAEKGKGAGMKEGEGAEVLQIQKGEVAKEIEQRIRVRRINNGGFYIFIHITC